MLKSCQAIRSRSCPSCCAMMKKKRVKNLKLLQY